MSRISPEVWARLAHERPHGDTLWARRAAPDISERIIAALDADDRRHLLILLHDNEGHLQDRQSRGIDVATRELSLPGHQSGQYLDIACIDATGHDAFDLIGGELADRVASGRETAPEVAARVLAKWRRFWGQLPTHMLSREAQLGLFAELWFLSVWLLARASPAETINRWRGPFGARHDFEWPSRSIEVKATTSTRGRIHWINGLDQLAPPEQGELLLFSLRLREEGGATNTLPSAVAACRAALEIDADALTRFEAALIQAGYSPAHEDEYAQLQLRVVEEALYRVAGVFPRLTEMSFPNGVPVGIERVEYEINLSGCGDLVIATTATAPQTLELLR